MDMLEHQKRVLKAVSDNPLLFQKELRKSLEWLNPKEIIQLKNWLRDRHLSHRAVIDVTKISLN